MTTNKVDEWFDGSELTTDSGLHLWAKECPWHNHYYLGLGVPVGSECDPPDQHGLAHFLEHVAFRGGKRFASAIAMREHLTPYSGKLLGCTNRQWTMYDLTVPPELLLHGLEVLSTLLFDTGYRCVDLEREIIRQERRGQLCSMEKISGAIISAAATGHPRWQHLTIGTDAGLLNINKNTLQLFHENWYHSGSTYGVIVGPRPEEVMLEAFNKALAWVPRQSEIESKLPPRTMACGPEVTRHWSEWDAHFNIAALSYNIELLSNTKTTQLAQFTTNMLGSDMTSPLYQTIREQSGLAYELDVCLQFNRGYNELYFSTSTRPDWLSRVRGCFEQAMQDVNQLRKIFPAVKQRLIQSISSNNNITSSSLGYAKLQAMLQRREISLRNDEISFIRSVTCEDIIQFVRQCLAPTRWRVVKIIP